MICCCAARPTRYKQRRQPCRTINSHKPSCHHSMHKSLVKTTLLMGHRGFYGSCTSADMGYRGLFQSRRYPSLASITTCSSSCLLPCRGSGIPSSWVLPLNFLVNPTPLDSLAMQSLTLLLVQLPSEREPLWKAPLWRCLSSPQRSGRTRPALRAAHQRPLQLLISCACQGCPSVGPHVPPSPSTYKLQSHKKHISNSGKLGQWLYKDGLVLFRCLGDSCGRMKQLGLASLSNERVGV